MVVVQVSLDLVRGDIIQICQVSSRRASSRQEVVKLETAVQTLCDPAIEGFETGMGGVDPFVKIVKTSENSIYIRSQSNRGQKTRCQNLFDQHCREWVGSQFCVFECDLLPCALIRVQNRSPPTRAQKSKIVHINSSCDAQPPSA